MNKKPRFTVDDAYSLETPADSVRLYDQWAPTYDTEFANEEGYVLFERVAEQLVSSKDRIDGPVLDIGCGTGLVGVSLREKGIETVDGIDISPAMLVEAGKKKTTDGRPVYRKLMQADLTRRIDIPDDRYAGLVSAGTFTHGHLGPGALDELWRVAAPGAHCAIGVRSTHFEPAGFGEKLAAAVASGTISQPKLIEVNVYSADASNGDHADDKTYIVVCEVN